MGETASIRVLAAGRFETARAHAIERRDGEVAMVHYSGDWHECDPEMAMEWIEERYGAANVEWLHRQMVKGRIVELTGGRRLRWVSA